MAKNEQNLRGITRGPKPQVKQHFISGLPRSGSTLLSALLCQNPRFHADISSPVAGLCRNVISYLSAGSEMGALVPRDRRRSVIKSIFHGYYADLPNNREVCFDTNRSWTSSLELVSDIFPDAKILCCVRNIAWIVDSIERQFRANPYENTGLFQNAVERSSLLTRSETLLKPSRMLGHALAGLQEALFSEHADRLLIIDYDKLVAAPKQVMAQVYRFLDEPEFAHDFENLAFSAEGFDTHLGLEGLHRVHQKVCPRPRPTLLPTDMFSRFSRMSFWENFAGQEPRTSSLPHEAISSNLKSRITPKD